MTAINIRDLIKTYADPQSGTLVEILNIAELPIKKGDHIALKGTSGSGKTTLLHCISGMLLPDSGSVEVLSTEITRLSEPARDRFRANHIGYIFQSFNLLEGFSALENVLLGMQFADKKHPRSRAEDLLERTGLSNRLHNRPGQLSVGQQQRVCIARALANDPEIILADEPTGSLDPRTSAEVLRLIREVSDGKTLVVVTHEEHVLNQFDIVIDLEHLNQALTA